MKRCPKCETAKPAADFAKKSTTKDGLQCWCRSCSAAGRAAWVAADSERAREKGAAWAKKNPEENRARSKAWKAENPERARLTDREYRATNAIRLTETAARWRAENRDEIRARKRAARLSRIEIYRLKSREWKAANHGKVIANVTARKKRVKRATPPWLTRDQRRDISALYELAALLSRHTLEPYHVDHVVPLIHDLVCGLHVPWNLQVRTAAANIKKSNRFDENSACAG